MKVFNKEPYPITTSNLKVFITYQAKQGIALNTLKSYISGIPYYFRTNDIQNLTLSNDFKMLKAGLQTVFKEDNSPFAKLSFKAEYTHMDGFHSVWTSPALCSVLKSCSLRMELRRFVTS